jgi:dTDP-4-amino-4,6-dideoxygalactose transaminase
LIRPWLYRKGVFPTPVPAPESRGDPPGQLLGRLADIQASLLLRQLKRLPAISLRRRSCGRALAEGLGDSLTDLPLMWYPFQVRNRDEVIAHFRKYQIELRRWEAPLMPPTCDKDRALFQAGSCPTAEEISHGCVALPTMLEKADLKRVIDVVSCYLETGRVLRQ